MFSRDRERVHWEPMGSKIKQSYKLDANLICLAHFDQVLTENGGSEICIYRARA